MCFFSASLTESITATAQEEERERSSLQHVSTPPRGEPGALSHPHPFSFLPSHSSVICSDFSGSRHEPFGDEVQDNTHPNHITTTSITATATTATATTQSYALLPLTSSQYKRRLRSQEARLRRAHNRITNRAAHRRNYRSWRTALTAIINTPSPALPQGTGSLGQPHPKPLYDLTSRALSHQRLQRQNSKQQPQPRAITPQANTARTHRCHKFRRFLRTTFKLKSKTPQNNSTPNHLRTDNRPSPQSRQQWQANHDTKHRQHTRAHWFKTHVAQPSKKGRAKHDIQTTPQHHLRGAFWNTTGLLEAGKLHTLTSIMKQHRLSWLVLTETHMKQPDQFMIDGFTITHSATEEYDDKGNPTQTYTGVSLITAPHLTPTITDLTCIDGRFLKVTIDTVEAPLSILAIYAPRNHREQQCRDQFWQALTTQLSTHRERTPLLVFGDFNALALDELAALPHATGLHFVPGKTAEEDEPADEEEGDTNQRQFHDLLASQDYCLPQSWMQKSPRHRHTHRRPNGDMVQLDHAIIHKDWRNIIHDIHTITGAALNSNHYLVKVDLQVRTKESKRTPPKPRHTRTPTTEQKQQYNTHIQKQLDPTSSTDDYSHSSGQLPLQPTPHSQWNILQHAAQDAISEHIPTTTSSPKHPWITQATWKLIQQRSDARLSQRLELEAQLHKDIRKQARKDKTQWLKARLAESEATLDPRQKWKWIKRIRSDYKPGQFPSATHRANQPANHNKPKSLQNTCETHTGQHHPPPTPVPPTPYTPQPRSTSHPSPWPSSQPLSSSWRTTKHPAPPAEAWQWLDEHNKEALLRVLNQSLLTATIPDDWRKAIVVEIYKGKGPLTDPASYRPISLLNTSHKLFAKIIHTRLQNALDDKLRETQYGFRATRSRHHPPHY